MWVAIIILILQVIALAAAAYSGRAKLKKLMNEAKTRLITIFQTQTAYLK